MVHEIEFRFRKCLSPNREPAVLLVQPGRPNEILKRCLEFAQDNNRRRRDALLIDFEEMFRTFFFCKKEDQTRKPNPHGTIQNSESSYGLTKESPQEKENKNPSTLKNNPTRPQPSLDKKGHRDVMCNYFQKFHHLLSESTTVSSHEPSARRTALRFPITISVPTP